MSRVVVDANVYLNALIRPEGPPGQILEKLLVRAPHTIIVSKEILQEVRRPLDYPKVRCTWLQHRWARGGLHRVR